MKKACFECFKALAAPPRYRIFEHLLDGKKMTVSALVRWSGLRQPTVTFHLGRLVHAGLIEKRRLGRNVYCQVNKKCPGCPVFSS